MKALNLLYAIILTWVPIVHCKRMETLFWRWDRKQLNATPAKSVPISMPEECFGLCLFDDRCKSFNTYEGMNRCDIFIEDRCSADVELVDDESATYFDTVSNGQCPVYSSM